MYLNFCINRIENDILDIFSEHSSHEDEIVFDLQYCICEAKLPTIHVMFATRT